MIKTFLAVFLILLASCTNKPCREVNTEGVPAEFLKPNQKISVFVYKYDGSKQCNQGQEISLEAMSKQLTNIQILSMEKRNDGMMRIQVCGAATGEANVYEIHHEDLQKAKESGFQEWKF